jgi:predicted ribosome quality control (RQC) complex YloA/Tae2 family protein
MARTTLRDSENNKLISADENNKLLLSDVVSSVRFRISKHREFITRDFELIKNNIGYTEIIAEALERIKSRQDKIDELEEFLRYSFK